jgi:hypothetical protein
MSDYVNELYNASGFEIDNCCVLGLHYTKEWGYKPDVGESWVIRTRPAPVKDKVRFKGVYGFAGAMFTGLWRSERATYAVTNTSQIHMSPDTETMEDHSTWTVHRIAGGIMGGVWGLDDQHVYAWYKTLDEQGHVVFYDGATWTELPPPPGRVLAMHGVSPDHVVAVGYGGLVARWDGKSWTKVAIPTKAVMTSVFIVGPDEMYAVGHDEGLWEGSASGWGRVAAGPGPLFGVAKFAGEVWVGAEKHGLWKRAGNKLECVDADLQAQVMDARGVLLITATDQLAETSDGVVFTKKAQGLLGRLRDAEPKLWHR